MASKSNSNIKEILDFLENNKLIFQGGSWSNSPLSLPFQHYPEDFIRFAEEDLKENNERALINALSNIKRAIDCRIESILFFCGIHEKAKNEDWNFPRKKKFLLAAGVVAPRILDKINRKRNEMEHDFKKPIREDVEDFLDIANLFILYTNPLVKKTYDDEFEFALADHPALRQWISISLKPNFKHISLTLHKNGHQVHAKCPANCTAEYMRILKYIVKYILSK